MRSLWLESGGWWRALVSALSLRCASPLAVTLAAGAPRNSRGVSAGGPLADTFCSSDGSNELRATSRLPPDCWRAVVACWTLKPISTIVAMFLSDNCCNNRIRAQCKHKNKWSELAPYFTSITELYLVSCMTQSSRPTHNTKKHKTTILRPLYKLICVRWRWVLLPATTTFWSGRRC